MSEPVFARPLAAPHIVVFGTIGPTGARHLVPVGFAWRDGLPQLLARVIAAPA